MHRVQAGAAPGNDISHDVSVLITGRGVSHFGGLTLTEPTEHRDADEAWEFTLDDENDPERVAQARSFAHLVRWPSRGDP